MYARNLKSKRKNWCAVIWQHAHPIRSTFRGYSPTSFSACKQYTFSNDVASKFSRSRFSIPGTPLRDSHHAFNVKYNREWSCCASRFYSSKGDGSNASEGKHVPAKDSSNFDKAKTRREKVRMDGRNCNVQEHALLGQKEQQEWLDNAKSSYDGRKRDSPFLTKKEKFRNEFMRRLIPWEKIAVSWDTFPYYLHEDTKNLLMECAKSHLKHDKFASSYGSRLASSSGRILLQSTAGSELYRERLVRALAKELQVPLLVLDSAALAPYDFSQDVSEDESDDETVETSEESAESEAEDDNESTNDEELSSSNEANSDGSDEEEVVGQTSPEALKNIIPFSLEEFAQRVSGEDESTSTSAETEDATPPCELRGPLKKGDRVKYVGATVHVEVDNRINLGKIPTSDGPTKAYTFISCRSLSNGQRGEVYEVNGDQVAVILDSTNDKTGEGGKDKQHPSGDTKPSIYWINIQDIVRDQDTESEDWYIAVEALSEVLLSLQPVIVYFPDSSEWLSRAVPKSHRKEFLCKVEEMFDHLSGPVLLISGQSKVEKGAPKEKKQFGVVLPPLDRIGQLPFSLKRLTVGLKASKTSKTDDIYKIFTNIVCIHPPKDEELLRTFCEQLEEDRKIVISRNNLVELSKVLDENEFTCMELLNVKTDGVILTRQKAEKVVGWARNHCLSCCSLLPCIKGDRLVLPRESLEIAVSRLREQETSSKKPSQTLKSLAKDEYESNFISAVVPPEEIGVKFDDIGALENVKSTLNELVILPMRRPELFSHGNLLRPCKGILLFGPPGTGKTLLAKALATEAGANFISITGSTLTSKWFGDAEKLTKALFSFASKLAPVIIFVDEVDSLLGARGGAFEHEATRRMRNEFMAAWDGLRSKDSQRILILGATNRPFDLDDAVIRRLPRRIYVDLPDSENRLKILKIFLSQERLAPDVRLEELANATEGYSGSDLKNLCIAAAYRPVQELLEEEKQGGTRQGVSSLRPLKLDDFLQAKTKVGASVAFDAVSMNELRKWNEQYGEGGSRRRTPFGFGL